jgi:CRP-like cAMP-binding protein
MAEKESNRDRDSQILERRFAPAGTVIMKQGEVGTNAYLVQSGLVSVTTESNGKQVDLAKLGAGQIFGEMSLVFDEPRTATVVATEDCNLIIITRQTLQGKLAKSDPTVRAIVPMLLKRIVSANNMMLRQMDDMDDLRDTVMTIFQNVHSTLPAAQKRSFDVQVKPKLEEFLGALREFSDRYALAEKD